MSFLEGVHENMNEMRLQKAGLLTLCFWLAITCACDRLFPKHLTAADVLASLRQSGHVVGPAEPDNYFQGRALEGIHAKVDNRQVKIFSFENHDAAARAEVEIQGEKVAALANPADVLLGTPRGIASSPDIEWHAYVTNNIVFVVIAKDKAVADAMFQSLEKGT